MALRFRGWLALGSTVGVVVVACGDDPVATTPAKLAQGCTLNSECATPLICAFQRCHTACNESRDCPTGQRCVAADGGKNVCLLPDEEECVSDAGCQGDQVCAEDQECRDPCTDDDHCIGDQVCSTSDTCADPDEVDPDGNLTPGSGGTGGSSGGGGKGGNGGKGGSGGDAGMGGESGEASGGRTGGTGGTGGSGGDAGQGEGAEGGTGGSSGNGGTAGTDPGTGGTAGTDIAAGGTSAGTSGSSGTAGGGAGGVGNGGTAGTTAGTAGSAGSAGSGGAGCIRELYGEYAVRTDGALLYEGAQERRIVDAGTALALTDVVNVLTGSYHGCAARTDGSAWCWPISSTGDQQGQVGDGPTEATTLFAAVRVKTSDTTYLQNVTSVASTSSYSVFESCAVAGGTVWCWGNTTDLLNNGTTTYTNYATQVTTNGTTPLSNVKEVALSWGHACALVDTGAGNEVWCWGDNDNAEAGTGSVGRVQYPTKIIGLVDPRALAVTAETSFAIDGDRVKCWGRNAFKECGINSNTSPQYTPVLVRLQGGTALDGVASLAATSSEACAERTDQSIWCWGNPWQMYAAAHPAVTPATGVVSVALGVTSNPRYLTSDGVLHMDTVSRNPDCGPLN